MYRVVRHDRWDVGIAVGEIGWMTHMWAAMGGRHGWMAGWKGVYRGGGDRWLECTDVDKGWWIGGMMGWAEGCMEGWV